MNYLLILFLVLSLIHIPTNAKASTSITTKDAKNIGITNATIGMDISTDTNWDFWMYIEDTDGNWNTVTDTYYTSPSDGASITKWWDITGLNSSEQYTFRGAYGTYPDNYVGTSSDKTFTTLAEPSDPHVHINETASISTTSATVKLNLSDLGTYDYTKLSVKYRDLNGNTNYSSYTNASGEGIYSFVLSDLYAGESWDIWGIAEDFNDDPNDYYNETDMDTFWTTEGSPTIDYYCTLHKNTSGSLFLGFQYDLDGYRWIEVNISAGLDDALTGSPTEKRYADGWYNHTFTDLTINTSYSVKPYLNYINGTGVTGYKGFKTNDTINFTLGIDSADAQTVTYYHDVNLSGINWLYVNTEFKNTSWDAYKQSGYAVNYSTEGNYTRVQDSDVDPDTTYKFRAYYYTKVIHPDGDIRYYGDTYTDTVTVTTEGIPQVSITDVDAGVDDVRFSYYIVHNWSDPDGTDYSIKIKDLSTNTSEIVYYEDRIANSNYSETKTISGLDYSHKHEISIYTTESEYGFSDSATFKTKTTPPHTFDTIFGHTTAIYIGICSLISFLVLLWSGSGLNFVISLTGLFFIGFGFGVISVIYTIFGVLFIAILLLMGWGKI